jgi:hypothetical protein
MIIKIIMYLYYKINPEGYEKYMNNLKLNMTIAKDGIRRFKEKSED